MGLKEGLKECVSGLRVWGSRILGFEGIRKAEDVKMVLVGSSLGSEVQGRGASC